LQKGDPQRKLNDAIRSAGVDFPVLMDGSYTGTSIRVGTWNLLLEELGEAHAIGRSGHSTVQNRADNVCRSYEYYEYNEALDKACTKCINEYPSSTMRIVAPSIALFDVQKGVFDK
jgi:hypothetical protein